MLNEVVDITVLKLKENKAHSEILKQELSSYRFYSLDKGRYQGYLIDIQRKASLRNFMGSIMQQVTEAFLGDSVTRNAASLLPVKVADSLSPYCNKVKSPSEKELTTVLSDKS